MHEPYCDQRQSLLDITRRLIELNASGTTDSADHPVRMATSIYCDENLFEKEKKEIFLREPQLVCFSSDLPEQGSYLCFDDLGIPIILVRDNSDKVRAFLNACSHRNARLREGCGVSKHLTCPYHAWRFSLEGNLESVYKAETFGEIDPEKYGLTSLPAEEKYGLVYVCPDPEGQIDIDAQLGELASLFNSWDLGSMTLIDTHEFDMQSNWKLALDTFCEGYHFSPLHRESVGDYALGNISAFDCFGPSGINHRLAFPNKWLTELSGKPESEWGDANEIFKNFQLVHYLYPNVSLLISPDACEFFRIYPGKRVGEHITRYSCYYRGHVPLETEEQRQEAQDHFNFIVKVVADEDYWVSGNLQKNMNTGLRTVTTFGRNEPALINMHRGIAAKLNVDVSVQT